MSTLHADDLKRAADEGKECPMTATQLLHHTFPWELAPGIPLADEWADTSSADEEVAQAA